MNIIGESLPRPDAAGKVTGAAHYPADLIKPEMYQLQVVFAGRPHARILGIDTSEALRLPGVVTVLTAADVPHNAFGLIDADQPVLCEDVVRFEGDKVALVVATNKQAAINGAQHVKVHYEDLPAVTDPHAALAPDAPLVHTELGTNQLFHFPLRKGDITQGFAQADVVLEGTFSTSWQEHAFLQPEAGIAYPDEQGRIVIETAGQWLHEDRRQIAAMLKLPEESVVIRYAAIGGAFGGREDLSMQHLLALAAWKLQHAVALIWNREESIIAHHKRHPVHIKCRWGATREGQIVAAEVHAIAEVLKVVGLFATGAYEIPHISVDAYAVYTNNIPCGAFRGFGAPQTQFACESMVTRLAQALKMDPTELRRRNLYHEGSIEPTNQPLPAGVSIRPVFERCVEEMHTRWFQYPQAGRERTLTPAAPQHGKYTHQTLMSQVEMHRGYNAGVVPHADPHQPAEPHLRRGIGLACGIKNVGYSFGYPEQATATVELYGATEVERAVVRVGAAEVGQGVQLILRQIAAEAIHLPPDKITMICNDSHEAPNAGSASASRMTLMAGRAVHDAAKDACKRWSWAEPNLHTYHEAQATVQYRAPRTTAVDPDTHTGTPNFCYGYAAQAVEVEVNMLTGQVQVLRIISVHDVGKAINMQQVTGQIEGCLAQALGYALLENFQVHNGHILTPHLSTYLLPTILDMPTDITPIVLELGDPNGPFGARGMAEMALVPFTAAVAHAIQDATGIWLSEQPMTPERVLQGLGDLRKRNYPTGPDGS
jgi:CO/xanthine dehydrogenase Mo-binding subunit